MTDIVEQLRTRDASLHVGAMCHEAADLIERLLGHIDLLHDEIERLRERLSLAQRWCSASADEIERLRRERMAMDEAMRQEMHHGSIRHE